MPLVNSTYPVDLVTVVQAVHLSKTMASSVIRYDAEKFECTFLVSFLLKRETKLETNYAFRAGASIEGRLLCQGLWL